MQWQVQPKILNNALDFSESLEEIFETPTKTEKRTNNRTHWLCIWEMQNNSY